MISLRQSISELDRLESLQQVALECYEAAIRAERQHAVEIDAEQTRRYRAEMEALARRVKAVRGAAELRETRLLFQSELQEYSGKTTRYLCTLRDKLTAATRSLQGIVEAMSHGEGDDRHLQLEIGRLSSLVQTPEVVRVCPELEVVASAVEESVSCLRKQTQLAMGQLRSEVHGLREALDDARRAASQDPISGVLNRAETLSQIRRRIKQKQDFSLVFVWISSLDYIRRRYGGHCRDEVIAEFSKSLASAAGSEAAAGRWGEDRFVVLIGRPKPEAIWMAETLEQQLKGPYVVKEPEFIREITVRLKTGVVECSPGTTEACLMKAVDKLSIALETVVPPSP